eukprot:scaffold21837_cov60-Attheya_sp.AAC.3
MENDSESVCSKSVTPIGTFELSTQNRNNDNRQKFDTIYHVFELFDTEIRLIRYQDVRREQSPVVKTVKTIKKAIIAWARNMDTTDGRTGNKANKGVVRRTQKVSWGIMAD